MSTKEFAEKMKELVEFSERDPEVAHIRADDIMCELLWNLGYQEGVEHFYNINKWYA